MARVFPRCASDVPTFASRPSSFSLHQEQQATARPLPRCDSLLSCQTWESGVLLAFRRHCGCEHISLPDVRAGSAIPFSTQLAARPTVAITIGREQDARDSIFVQRRAAPAYRVRGGSRGPQLAPHGELGPHVDGFSAGTSLSPRVGYRTSFGKLSQGNESAWVS